MLKFYDVDKDYIDYLKKYDSKIPNISYNSHDKFVCGVVLTINSKDYYAPISSFAKQQRTNILLKNSSGRVTSSIRLSFMFPVPKEKISVHDFSKEAISYRRLLMEEYKYCNTHEKEIIEKAQYIYKSVIQDKNPLMEKNCCDFAKLEAAADLYIDPQQLRQKPPTVSAAPAQPRSAADIFKVAREKAARVNAAADRQQPDKSKNKGQEIE